METNTKKANLIERNSTISWHGMDGEPIPFECVIDFSACSREDLERLAVYQVLVDFRAAVKRNCTIEKHIKADAVRRCLKKKITINALDISAAATGLNTVERLAESLKKMTKEELMEFAAKYAELGKV